MKATGNKTGNGPGLPMANHSKKEWCGYTLLSHFIERHPEYKWLDTLGIEHVITGGWGTGAVSGRKFRGFEEVK
jgi:hypothetical protein